MKQNVFSLFKTKAKFFSKAVGIMLALTGYAAYAARTNDDFLDSLADMSIEELLNVEITLASNTEKSIREQPGIISVIHEEEIQNSGARDLIDVLRQVPGFDFGFDIQSVTGPYFRGLWAYEGKTLIVIDGQETNGLLFGIPYSGLHYPLDQIKQIEIIRGPGAAKYGGNAQLAVIKITSKGAEINGVEGTAAAGHMKSRHAHAGGTLTAGEEFEHGSYSLSASRSTGYASDENYTDFIGTEWDLEEDSRKSSSNLNLGLAWKDLDFRLIADNSRFDHRDYFGFVDSARRHRFDTRLMHLKYRFQATDSLTITPMIKYNEQKPWQQSYRDSGGPVYRIKADRLTYNLAADYAMSENANISGGFEYYKETAKARDTFLSTGGVDASIYFFGDSQFSVRGKSAFFQTEWTTDIANFTLGGRYTDNSRAGESFVPRFALTKVWDKWHFKFLYSHAFREPNLEVMRNGLDPLADMSPEITKTAEVEIGRLLSEDMFITANIFHIAIKDPIVFTASDTGFGAGYTNRETLVSRGMELEWRVKKEWGHVNLGWSYYQAHKNPVDVYQAEADDDVFLGAPSHKLTLNGSFRLFDIDGLTLNPSVYWISKRYGYAYDPSQPPDDDFGTQSSEKRFDPEILANIFLRYQKDGFSFGAGVFDLFDEQHDFVQAYNGGGAPLPAETREFYVKMSYQMDFE